MGVPFVTEFDCIHTGNMAATAVGISIVPLESHIFAAIPAREKRSVDVPHIMIPIRFAGDNRSIKLDPHTARRFAMRLLEVADEMNGRIVSPPPVSDGHLPRSSRKRGKTIRATDSGSRAGGFVRGHRMRLGWTLKALAEKVEVSTSTIGHVETGRDFPSRPLFMRLCKALDVPPPREIVGALLETKGLTKPTTEEYKGPARGKASA